MTVEILSVITMFSLIRNLDCDGLSVIKCEDNNITLKSNTNEISNGDDNLIIKAAMLLRNEVGNRELNVIKIILRIRRIMLNYEHGDAEESSLFLGN